MTSRHLPSAWLLLLGLVACAPGAGGWLKTSRFPEKALPAAVELEVLAPSRNVAEPLYDLLQGGLRSRGYRLTNGTPEPRRWTLSVEISTFDVGALQSERRVYVEMAVRGLGPDPGPNTAPGQGQGKDRKDRELFRLELARSTYLLAGTANAKRRAHLVELSDAIVAALPRPAATE
ncbi:MAG TPA: hypothetical protein VH877_31095 [Polyangia bacterium]|jgi:hypothetical protein|nr:hypothetical protein [Polyangia bacterium]